jgi:hypothetical protein
MSTIKFYVCSRESKNVCGWEPGFDVLTTSGSCLGTAGIEPRDHQNYYMIST